MRFVLYLCWIHQSLTTCSPATPKLDNILLHKYFATCGNVSCILLRTSNFNWISFVDIIEIYNAHRWYRIIIRNIFNNYKLFIGKTCLLSFKQMLTFMKIDQKPPFRHFRIKSNYEMSWHIKIKVLQNECLTFSLTRKGGVIY